MSLSTFTLQLPTAGSFPGLVGEVTSRWLELAGVASEASRVAQEIGRAASDLCAHATDLDCTFAATPTGLEITLRAGAEHRTIRCPRA